ncbi:MAG: class II aldolase/adducin family protein [Chloroflexota bacterium]
MPHVHWEGKVIQEVSAADVHAIDLEGKVLDGDPIDVPEERFFHVELYKARPDIGGLIYGHPNMSCAFAAAGRDTLSVFGEKVPIMPAPGFGSGSEKGQKVARALGQAKAVVWSGGNVVVGKSIEEACVTAFVLEREAERQLFVTILGGKPDPEVHGPPIEDLAGWMTKLGFAYFEAMDRGPRRETMGRLLWTSPGMP